MSDNVRTNVAYPTWSSRRTTSPNGWFGSTGQRCRTTREQGGSIRQHRRLDTDPRQWAAAAARSPSVGHTKRRGECRRRHPPLPRSLLGAQALLQCLKLVPHGAGQRVTDLGKPLLDQRELGLPLINVHYERLGNVIHDAVQPGQVELVC